VQEWQRGDFQLTQQRSYFAMKNTQVLNPLPPAIRDLVVDACGALGQASGEFDCWEGEDTLAHSPPAVVRDAADEGYWAMMDLWGANECDDDGGHGCVEPEMGEIRDKVLDAAEALIVFRSEDSEVDKLRLAAFVAAGKFLAVAWRSAVNA
jgi:hypothetical protein